MPDPPREIPPVPMLVVRARCPKCETLRVRCYSTVPYEGVIAGRRDAKIRYYKCKVCGWNFSRVAI